MDVQSTTLMLIKFLLIPMSSLTSKQHQLYTTAKDFGYFLYQMLEPSYE